MYRGSRGGAPILWVIQHVNVGPEVEHGAQGLLNYLNGNGPNGGGYHTISDNKTLVRAANDNQVVYGAYRNSTSLHHCDIGSADQSRDQWLDAYSKGELNLSAAQTAQWCLDYDLPIRRLTEDQLRAQEKGIAGHIDITNAFKAEAAREGIHLDHYDPGPYFPWDVFLPLVALAAGQPGPLPPIVHTEDLMTTIAIGKGGGTARPVPALGGVLLENGARLSGDTAVKGSTNHFWRHPKVPANATLVDIVDFRTIGEAKTIAALYDFHDNSPSHPYRAVIAN